MIKLNSLPLTMSSDNYPGVTGNYTYIKELFLERMHRSFKYAQYVDGNGKKYFVKFWANKKKNFDYYSLINEIKIYESLNIFEKTHGDFVKKKFPNIKIPKIICYSISDCQVAIMVEWLNYSDISELTASEKTKIYINLMNYFEFISNEGLVNFSSIPRRSSLLMLILIFPLALNAIRLVPKQSLTFIKILAKMYVVIPAILSPRKRVLVHRSIEDHNILMNGGVVYPIDYQLAVISDPLLELSQTMYFSWRDQDVIRHLMGSTYFKDIDSSYDKKNILKTLCIYTGLVHVTLDIDNRDVAINFIKYATTI